jgi:hypothetical protein
MDRILTHSSCFTKNGQEPTFRRNAWQLCTGLGGNNHRNTHVESLHMAVASLGSSKRIDVRQPAAAYAPEIGLIGASAELAMSACLVQALGSSAVVWASGQYKTAAQILDDFRDLSREGESSEQFVWLNRRYGETETQLSRSAITPSIRVKMP